MTMALMGIFLKRVMSPAAMKHAVAISRSDRRKPKLRAKIAATTVDRMVSPPSLGITG